ncbi:MAG: FAD-dependent oxidoreductase [Pseudomonadota bacterium]
MKRDLDALGACQFDVVVIGAGIHGAAAAWLASAAGLRVAIVDAGDLGGATSANSLRIAHGGLRYLQTLDLRRSVASIAARRHLFRCFPSAMTPLRCVASTPWLSVRNPLFVSVALWLNRLISRSRNDGVIKEKRLPSGRLLSVTELSDALPGIGSTEAVRGFEWWDGLIAEPHRIVLGYLRAAATRGAIVANYVVARRLRRSSESGFTVDAEDVPSGRALTIAAANVIDSRGPWLERDRDVDRSLQRPDAAAAPIAELMTALNVVVARSNLPVASAAAIAARSVDGIPGNSIPQGDLFLVPGQSTTTIGTYYVRDSGKAPSSDVLDDFITHINAAIAPTSLSVDDILAVQWGHLPAEANGLALRSHDALEVTKAKSGRGGYAAIGGVKWTTAALVAASALDQLELQPPAVGVMGSAPMQGNVSFYQFAVKTTERLDQYPEPLEALARLLETPGQAHGLAAQADAVAQYCTAHEAALSLDDLVRRRLPVATLSAGGEPLIAALAKAMAEVMDWDLDHTRAQLDHSRAALAGVRGIAAAQVDSVAHHIEIT